MNMLDLLHPVIAGCFLFLLAHCCFWDIKERRISNRAVATMLVLALFSFFNKTFDALTLWGAGVALTLVIPWHKGAIGAGDVKLLFVSALYLGLTGFCLSLALTGIAAFIYIILARKRATGRVAMGALFAPAAAAIILLKELMLN
jgi:Flp pilus assembly protein, protease CpaA